MTSSVLDTSHIPLLVLLGRPTVLYVACHGALYILGRSGEGNHIVTTQQSLQDHPASSLEAQLIHRWPLAGLRDILPSCEKSWERLGDTFYYRLISK